MNATRLLALCCAGALWFACATDGEGDAEGNGGAVGGGGTGGGGGTIHDPGGNGGTGGSGEPCDEEEPACCEDPDRMPCLGLDEATCADRAWCMPVEAPLAHDRDGERHYVGCSSRCGIHDDAPVCVYEPDAPDVCYFVQSGVVPDGWLSHFDCIIPDGACTASQ